MCTAGIGWNRSGVHQFSDANGRPCGIALWLAIFQGAGSVPCTCANGARLRLEASSLEGMSLCFSGGRSQLVEVLTSASRFINAYGDIGWISLNNMRISIPLYQRTLGRFLPGRWELDGIPELELTYEMLLLSIVCT